MMLQHLGQNEVAEKISNAWLRTIEQGIHTYDIYQEGTSKKKVGTSEFAQFVIGNLGKKPEHLAPVEFKTSSPIVLPKYRRKTTARKDLLGVDVFVHWNGEDANVLAQSLQKLNSEKLQLSMITNRGIKVWPNGFEETFCTDHWRCRFNTEGDTKVDPVEIINLLGTAVERNIDIIKTENLYAFEGIRSFSLGQGQ